MLRFCENKGCPFLLRIQIQRSSSRIHRHNPLYNEQVRFGVPRDIPGSTGFSTLQRVVRLGHCLCLVAVFSLWAGTAYADSISPILIPGFSTSSAGLFTIILATLLAMLIEVPYVSMAGVQERVWRRTLVANCISTFFGIFFPAYVAARSEHFNLYLAAAVVLSILTEGAYLCWAASKRLNWGWLIVGNTTSALVLLWLSSLWAVSMDRSPDALRDLGADVYYSWYQRQHNVSCVNPDLVDDAKIKQWVPYLKELHVRYLDISDSKVTDEGLVILAEVPTLTRLSVGDTCVTQQGAEKLQRSLPRVVINPYLDGKR